MIETAFATAIVLVLLAALVLMLFSSPWWVTVWVVATIVLLLDWLVNRAACPDKKGD
jgi:uncharacterized membrane protein